MLTLIILYIWAELVPRPRPLQIEYCPFTMITSPRLSLLDDNKHCSSIYLYVLMHKLTRSRRLSVISLVDSPAEGQHLKAQASANRSPAWACRRVGDFTHEIGRVGKARVKWRTYKPDRASSLPLNRLAESHKSYEYCSNAFIARTPTCAATFSAAVIVPITLANISQCIIP